MKVSLLPQEQHEGTPGDNPEVDQVGEGKGEGGAEGQEQEGQPQGVRQGAHTGVWQREW